VTNEARLAVYNAAVDAALDHRVELHRLRAAGDLDVKPYLEGLRAVRDVEDTLEPLRRKAGAVGSRAYELSRAELQTAEALA
jgi:hypothetical protein